MDIRPIRTDTGYRTVLKEVETLMTAESKSRTPEDSLTLIEVCERKHFPFDLPDPAEAIKCQRPGTHDWKKQLYI